MNAYDYTLPISITVLADYLSKINFPTLCQPCFKCFIDPTWQRDVVLVSANRQACFWRNHAAISPHHGVPGDSCHKAVPSSITPHHCPPHTEQNTDRRSCRWLSAWRETLGNSAPSQETRLFVWDIIVSSLTKTSTYGSHVTKLEF